MVETGINCDVRKVSQRFFDTTKRWWGIAWAAKLVAFLLGIPTVFLPEYALWFAIGVALLAFFAEAAGINSSWYKSTADGLLRKLDLRDGFGWQIDSIDIADARMNLSGRDRNRVDLARDTGEYFATGSETGWKRAVENLRESAWWSKHLALSMGRIAFTATILLSVASMLGLLVSFLLFSSMAPLIAVSRIIIALLLLVVSVGLIPLTISYWNFSKRSEQVEKNASKLLEKESDEEIPAIKLVSEYHVARSAGPLIPSWLWKCKRKTLNETWEKYIVQK
ncbi:MAG: hypothetical protein WKF34_07135 [Pyrinomonadaceae bacterium]